MSAINKSEIRRWIARARLNCRDIERLLRNPGPVCDDDREMIREWASDLVGCGGEIECITEGDA